MKENTCKLLIQIIDQYLEYIENFKKLNVKVENPIRNWTFHEQELFNK